MRILYILTIGLLTCTNPTGKNIQTDNIPVGSTNFESKQARLLISSSIQHSFSDLTKKDTFKLNVTGESILKGNFTFEIIDFSGKSILKETFPTSDLLGFGIEENTTDKQKEEYIKKRIKDFFKEDNFISPAIKTSETFEEEYSDKDIWTDIKSDKTAIGFTYLIGEEDNRSIAYSKKKKKVVMYFNCC